MVKTTRRFRLVTSCSGVVGALNERFILGIASAPRKIEGNTSKINNKLFFN